MQGSSRNRSAGDQPDSFEEALGKERGVRAGQLIDELTALVFEADPDGAAVITLSCRDESMSRHLLGAECRSEALEVNGYAEDITALSAGVFAVMAEDADDPEYIAAVFADELSDRLDSETLIALSRYLRVFAMRKAAAGGKRASDRADIVSLEARRERREQEAGGQNTE